MQLSNRERANTRRLLVIGLAGVLLLGLGIVAGLALAGGAPLATRQADVAERGAQVMPFDLDRTTHVFEKLDNGGLQTVRADAPVDAVQVRLIQAHLAEEAEKFRRGDFSDPAAIHGQSMPGLDVLRASAGRIDVAYTPLPDSGQIRYSTSEPALVDGLHQWFDAQLMDHGSHATETK
jgi:hypothetical protein